MKRLSMIVDCMIAAAGGGVAANALSTMGVNPMMSAIGGVVMAYVLNALFLAILPALQHPVQVSVRMHDQPSTPTGDPDDEALAHQMESGKSGKSGKLKQIGYGPYPRRKADPPAPADPRIQWWEAC